MVGQPTENSCLNPTRPFNRTSDRRRRFRLARRQDQGPHDQAQGGQREASWSEAEFNARVHGPEETAQAGGNSGSGRLAINKR
jgi:hypothetical protein